MSEAGPSPAAGEPVRASAGHRPGGPAVLAVLCLLLVGAVVAASAVTRGGGARGGDPLASGRIDVLTGDAAPDSVLVTRALLSSASAAIVVAQSAPAADRDAAVALARDRRVPVFVVPTDGAAAVAAELRRLAVTTVVNVGGEVAGLDVGQTGDTGRLRGEGGVTPIAGRPVVLVTDGAPNAAADAELAGADVVVVPVADPRATGASVAAVRRADDPAILAVGPDFGDAATFRERIELARTVPELPGGGQLLFPGRRVVALYGSPGSEALGPLGRQDLPATVARARDVARPYERLSPVPVVPGFEIIVTVASAEPGFRGAYTNVIEPKVIEPWVDAAARAGIYVTLDLQPGRMDFPTQAKMYEGLLRRPNVGLALDPEWRLKPDQVHLRQIGAVAPEEVNATAAWLADLVRRNNLPQKAFVLHQFDADMLGDRRKLNTAHPELAVVLHADGHGIPKVKMGTWGRMITGLPPNIWMGWKNFYKEDKPMFSPAQTMAVVPVPYFISYQ